MGKGKTWQVREGGRNGTIHIEAGTIVRTIRKTLGKDDILTVPLRSISGVFHDRKTMRTDTVKVNAGMATYEWKIKDAQGFVTALNDALAQQVPPTS